MMGPRRLSTSAGRDRTTEFSAWSCNLIRILANPSKFSSPFGKDCTMVRWWISSVISRLHRLISIKDAFEGASSASPKPFHPTWHRPGLRNIDLFSFRSQSFRKRSRSIRAWGRYARVPLRSKGDPIGFEGSRTRAQTGLDRGRKVTRRLARRWRRVRWRWRSCEGRPRALHARRRSVSRSETCVQRLRTTWDGSWPPPNGRARWKHLQAF